MSSWGGSTIYCVPLLKDVGWEKIDGLRQDFDFADSGWLANCGNTSIRYSSVVVLKAEIIDMMRGENTFTGFEFSRHAAASSSNNDHSTC
jgi:hypothetical protein